MLFLSSVTKHTIRITIAPIYTRQDMLNRNGLIKVGRKISLIPPTTPQGCAAFIGRFCCLFCLVIIPLPKPVGVAILQMAMSVGRFWRRAKHRLLFIKSAVGVVGQWFQVVLPYWWLKVRFGWFYCQSKLIPPKLPNNRPWGMCGQPNG